MPNLKKTKTPYLSENLRTIRRSVGVSQQKIADSLSINRTTYTKWETKEAEPSYHFLSKIIEFYNEKGIFLDYNMIISAPIKFNIVNLKDEEGTY